MKFALVVLAFMTPVSLSLLFSAIEIPNSKPLDASIVQQYAPRTILDDTDGDGLSNRDENLWRTDWRNPDTDGDGFKDGEEVLSGHDPTKPGPNDFLDVSQNVTKRISTLLAGGIISGDIQPDSPDNIHYLDEIVGTVFDEYKKFTLTPRHVELNVVESSSISMKLYVAAMAPHWKETFPESIRFTENYLGLYGSVDAARTEQLLNDEKRYKKMLTESTRLSTEFQELAQSLQDIPVPEAMANAHRNSVLLLRAMAEQIRIASSHKEDPVGATLATTALASLATRTSAAFIYDYIETLRIAVNTYINAPAQTLETEI